MEWLTDFIKHLAISRTLVGAVFVTSIVMVVGPKVYPTLVPAVPQPWSSALFGVMVLSSALLILWCIAALWSLLARGVRATSTTISAATLNQGHTDVLHAMGNNPSQPLNLDNINYDQAPFSRLEIEQLMRELKQKGLVSFNEWGENLVSLTQSGKERALEIQRRAKK